VPLVATARARKTAIIKKSPIAIERASSQTTERIKSKQLLVKKRFYYTAPLLGRIPLMRLFPTSSQRVLSGVCGAFFIGTGIFKLLVPFGSFLESLRVPLPQLAGIGVPLLEICGGAILLFGHRLQKLLPPSLQKNAVRLACLTLAIDMIVAIVLVGVPGRKGQTHSMGAQSIGSEPWRLPLEVFLLTVMLWFIWQPPTEDG
jgi:uncharacterized membrane protein YphA (DoxX/SURF4 family)